MIFKCTKCKESKNIKEFYNDKTKRGHTTYCKNCQNLTNLKNVNTLHGFLNKLLITSRSTAKKRCNNGRTTAGIHTITFNNILDLWNCQQGLCYYSGMSLNHIVHSDWNVSLERIDPTQGYTIDNIVLVAQEFNSASQWSLSKIKNIRNLLITQPLVLEDFKQKPKKGKCYRNPLPKIINGVIHKWCGKCQSFKIFKHSYCNECISKISRGRLSTIRESLKRLLYHTNRGKYKSFLTYDDMVYLYKTQNGKCAYSGIPFRLPTQTNSDWKMSLERIDTTKDYTKENVALICHEFNTSNKTKIKTQYSKNGHAGWTRDKFLLCYDTIYNKNLNETK